MYGIILLKHTFIISEIANQTRKSVAKLIVKFKICAFHVQSLHQFFLEPMSNVCMV